MYRKLMLTMLLFVLSFSSFAGAAVAAQDVTPSGGAAGPCAAPELPPGTPTPMEAMASPAAMQEMASPEAGAEDSGPPPEAAETPAGTPVTGADADTAAAGLENLVNCVNAGDYLAAAALMTDNFVTNFIGVPTRYDVPAAFEDPEFPVQPIEIRAIGEVHAYDDGLVSVDWIYTGLFSGPGALSSERWYFMEDDGFYTLDNIMPIPVPEGALPEATIVDVQMVNYAFALSTNTIPAGPVIFRMANTPDTNEPHVGVVVTYLEGTTTPQLIGGEVDVLEDSTGFFGAIYLEPGQSGDLVFENLEPGTYFLGCDVETADGTPHYELGMVT
ncbi:MAG: hypothetical protein H0V24_09890, partial [Chloroflexia bacterium]|nr:hypothetical protein [Chloroflexia bacterium]